MFCGYQVFYFPHHPRSEEGRGVEEAGNDWFLGQSFAEAALKDLSLIGEEYFAVTFRSVFALWKNSGVKEARRRLEIVRRLVDSLS